MSKSSRRAVLKTIAATLTFPAMVHAQGTWPGRPIRCIVPLPPGGGTDAIGRRAMQSLSEALACPDLMNGTVAVMLDNPSDSAGLVREGRMTGFAVTRPSPVLPKVPTFESQGVKGFDAVFWYGVVAPAGLPPEIALRIQKILADALLTDAGRPSLAAIDATAVMSTPAEFASTMARQTQDLRTLADRLGIKPT